MEYDFLTRKPILDLKSKEILREKLLKRKSILNISKLFKMGRTTLYTELFYGMSKADFEKSRWKNYSPKLAVFRQK